MWPYVKMINSDMSEPLDTKINKVNTNFLNRGEFLPILNSLINQASKQSDVTYNPGSPTTYTISSLITLAKTLTIGANATLEAPATTGLHYIICQSLVLNGVIKGNIGTAGSTDGNGGGSGGGGANGIVVIAGTITGTGTIKSNGANGADGVAPTGTTANGTIGEYGIVFDSYGVPGYGGAGVAGYYASSGAVSGGAKSMFYYIPSYPIWLLELFKYVNSFIAVSSTSSRTLRDMLSMCSGAGSNGLGINDTGGRYKKGGGGGGSLSAAGGNGAYTTSPTSATGSGGGGGGAGGFVGVISLNAIPALTLQAIGGNGGNGYGTESGGGGGGAGGTIIQITPSSSASTSVAGGTKGTSTLSSGGTDGSAGASYLFDVSV